MRFKDLSPQTVDSFWQRWKHIVREILDELNYDVYQAGGIVRENAYYERAYLSLQTKKECLYIFPMAGDKLVLSLCKCKIEKEYLNLKSTHNILDREKLIGWVGLEVGCMEERYGEIEDRLRSGLVTLIRRLYRKHGVDLLF